MSNQVHLTKPPIKSPPHSMHKDTCHISHLHGCHLYILPRESVLLQIKPSGTGYGAENNGKLQFPGIDFPFASH